MSQERTEREELDQSLIRTMRFEQSKGYRIAGEMAAALRELDRLTAERDAAKEAFLDEHRQRLAFMHEVEEEKNRSEALLDDNSIAWKEVERLRAAGEKIIEESVRMSYEGYDDANIPYESAAIEWRAALKGAE